MKNTEIKNLEEVVPVEIRLEVYKEALELFESGKSMVSKGLCLLLPCLLWDLGYVTALAPDENDWDYADTIIAFPELTQEHISAIFKTETSKEADELRMEYLKQFIETAKQL